MKVCLISTWPPMQCGIADFVYKITGTMPQTGLNIGIITYNHKTGNRDAPRQELTGPKVYRILSKKKISHNTFKLIKLLENINPHIIHLHMSYFLFPKAVQLTLLLYSRFSGKKLILTLHDVIPGKRGLRFRYLLCSRLLAASGLCVVHSKIAFDELREYYNIPVNKIVVIPHGVYVPGEDKPPALPEVGNFTRYILSAGFIRESKGLDYLIEAFAGIGERHNVYLVIAGTVQEPGSNKDMETYKNEMKYFQALKESTRQNNKIIWMDCFLSPAELNWLLLHAEVVVFSYTDCSQSGMFHRALGYNKPIVATSVGNFAEIINHGVNGLLVSPKNSPELHHAIDMLLSDKELGKKISASLKEEKIPTIKEISLRYRQLYQQIMGE